MDARVCLLVICASVCVGVHVNKGYLCRDPDTGMLYGINATWAATSFCGNYTCRIRPKNHTIDTSESRTVINVTTPESTEEKQNVTLALSKAEKPNFYPKNAEEFFESQEGAQVKPIFFKNDPYVQASQPANVITLPVSNDGGDRYLNGEEIKTISELLHTVKKSDLEAVVEIYNLAQDIYKELDEVDVSNTVDVPTGIPENNTPKSAKSSEIEKRKDRTYWYEPVLSEVYRLADLKPEGSEFVPSPTNTRRPAQLSSNTATPPSYFSGVLNNRDFGRLAYYYPNTNFQKSSYYYQQQRPHTHSYLPSNIPSNIPANIPSNIPPPALPNPCALCTRPPPTSATAKDQRTHPFYPPTMPTQPSLLPYPFLTQLNNGSFAYNNYNNYYKGNPWAYYDYYRNYPYNLLRREASTININPKPVQNEEPKLADANNTTEAPKNESKPWKTESLSEELINEIRANIAERTKLLRMPLRKRIKLERVAKVIKLDHLNRQTRKTRAAQDSTSGEDPEEFEVYIEKTTCTTDKELGYFRVGNVSQPFPHCCPQKIEVR